MYWRSFKSQNFFILYATYSIYFCLFVTIFIFLFYLINKTWRETCSPLDYTCDNELLDKLSSFYPFVDWQKLFALWFEYRKHVLVCGYKVATLIMVMKMHEWVLCTIFRFYSLLFVLYVTCSRCVHTRCVWSDNVV